MSTVDDDLEDVLTGGDDESGGFTIEGLDMDKSPHELADDDDECTLSLERVEALRKLKKPKEVSRYRLLEEFNQRRLKELRTWQPDFSSRVCMRCEREFSFVRRRHHCRQCGLLVCSDCSAHEAICPPLFGQPEQVSIDNLFGDVDAEETLERICDACFEQNGGSIRANMDATPNLALTPDTIRLLKQNACVPRQDAKEDSETQENQSKDICGECGQEKDLLEKLQKTLHQAVGIGGGMPLAMQLQLEKALREGYPIWVEDSVGCVCCRVPFNFFVRRHHCRNCGELVCGKCSTQRLSCPRIVGRPEDDRDKDGLSRSCDRCHDAYMATLTEEELTYVGIVDKRVLLGPDGQELTEDASLWDQMQARWRSGADDRSAAWSSTRGFFKNQSHKISTWFDGDAGAPTTFEDTSTEPAVRYENFQAMSRNTPAPSTPSRRTTEVVDVDF